MEGNQAPNDIENPHIELVTWMRSELDELLSPQPLMDCCIYRVPDRLRCLNEKVYTPQVVSIGPLHHGKESLKPMEEQKKRYLQGFLERTKAKVSLEEYIKKVKNQEIRLRGCYEESIVLSSDEFVRIILIDAAFIIELFLTFCCFQFNITGLQTPENDRIFNKPYLIHYIVTDMQLLENQVPFFILEDLFDLDSITVSSGSTSPPKRLSMIDLSNEFFRKTVPIEVEPYSLKRIFSSSSNPKVEHFLDLIRTLHLPILEEESDQSNEGPSKSIITTPCITELHQAGVKFKLASSRNLFDIRFNDGILEIPKIKIHDNTEITVRNLLAFEQCHCHKNYIGDYVSLLDDFVNTEKDVELLKDGIVENMLGDDNEVSILINNLGRGIAVDPNSFHFATLSERLNSYCRKPWNKWKANLRQHYFNTPWATISVIAAVFLLILTCTQTVCSIIAVMPSKNQNRSN